MPEYPVPSIPPDTYAPLVNGVVQLVNLPVGADDLAVGLVGMSLLDPTDGLVLDVETKWGIDPTDGPYWEEYPADVVAGEEALFRIEEDGTMSWILMSEVR